MTTIDKDIADIIEKNLPAHVGTALQKRLAQAETDAAELARARDHAVELRGKIAGLETTVRSKSDDLNKHSALEKREEAVRELERNASLLKVQVELAAEQRISNVLTDTLKLLVRNTEFRQSSFGNMPVAVDGLARDPSGYGGTPGSIQTGHYNNTTTTSKD